MKQRNPFGANRRRAVAKKRAAKLGQPEAYGYEPMEDDLQWQTVKLLRSVGYHVSVTSQKRASRVTEGIPDLWFSHPAWRIYGWIEMKRPGKEPTDVQETWHEENRAAGCPVLVCTGPEDAVSQLERLRAERRKG